jgi:hypothetical protein
MTEVNHRRGTRQKDIGVVRRVGLYEGKFVRGKNGEGRGYVKERGTRGYALNVQVKGSPSDVPLSDHLVKAQPFHYHFVGKPPPPEGGGF